MRISLLGILLLVFTTFTTRTHAQDDAGNQSYSAITLYGAVPTGDFADAAKFGGGLGFEGAYYVLPMLGIAYGADIQINPYNRDEFPDIGGDQISTQPWLGGNLMTGLEFSYPITAKFAPEVRAMGGLMVTRFPEITVDAGVTSFTQEAQIKPAFAYSFSGGVKLMPSEGRIFRVGLQYLTGSPEYEAEALGVSVTENVDISNVRFYISMGF